MGRVAAAVLVMMAAMGCNEPPLPAACDEPSGVLIRGGAEVCDRCGGDCVEMCAFSCDVTGRVSATQVDEIVATLCDPDNIFCGRWVAD